MKALFRISMSLFFVLMLSTIHANPIRSGNSYVSHFENVLGTSLALKVKTASEQKASVAEAAALQEIQRLSSILSTYDANSEFSKWMRTQKTAVPVSAELMEVLQLFDQWKLRSSGALDPAAQVISNLWKEAARAQQLPDAAAKQAAVASVQQTHWILDPAKQTAIHLTNTPLVLNSFVKSYIIRKATDKALAESGAEGIMMNIGGDIVVAGDQTESIRISDPRADAENDAPLAKIRLQHLAVATSGNYRRGVSINGQWYSHIVDPRTAEPASAIISATVVSPNATDAGAMATAFTIVTPAEAEQMAAAVPGTEYLLITNEGKRIESKGWNALEEQKTEKIITSLAKADQWNTDFEVVINLELAQFPGFARRPFVAIWVEDKETNTVVRTVSVWYNKERWLHDLRAWYGNFAKYNSAEGGMATIASATRSAGKYTLKWDGKDDKGNYVKPGTYVIKIEAAREHGTYQIMSQEIECAKKKAQQFTIPGNTEISAASVEYKKKG
jgi:thiamine biosynthesis lipoprotein ApbE